ncbi:hypothetical protein GALMADRAFT_252413 [Galerina marginata CBS 339.88]|uniref:Uncharacterized protein n=1 Tax=Galerina marginata (strain CBS 339.88) TaxID=685588 RepID=A0A067SZB7_GALM3|nr:hypothetical protein GALMADRAFT_252413 [Galerina marginata CBS 339.88]
MSKQWQLDQQYADVMGNHPFGIALYRPLPRSSFNPGSCGYFDDFGAWNPIAHFDDGAEALREKGLSTAQELEKAPVDDGIIWGPKTSSRTRATKVELSGGIDPALGIPITVSAVYSYSVDKDIGAILLTSPRITYERYYHSSPFKRWCKENAPTILRRWPEVKTHGLWIITSTHSTKKCAINMWDARGRRLKVGFDAEVAGLGKAGPNGSWYRSQSDEGWGEYTTEGDDKSVVFFGGLKFQYSWVLGRDLKRIATDVLRGEEQPESITAFLDPGNEEKSFLVDCEEYLSEEESKEPPEC